MPERAFNTVLTLLRRLRGTVRTSTFEREMAEEFRLHIEFETDALMARGMDRAGARREARRRFGSVAVAGDECRDSWGVRSVDALAQDFRYALRMIAKHPACSAAIVLMLALGIGANTAIFSVVHAVLLRSLPYAAGDRLVEIRQQLTRHDVDNMGLSAPDLADYRAAAQAFDGIVEYHQMSFTLLDGSYPSRVLTGVVSAQFFDVLGIKPFLGRTFRSEDDAREAPAVVILAYAYWQKAFGGDPAIVGRTFEMNDRVHTVVGVLPPVPQYPSDNDVYMPVSACPFRSAPAMDSDRRMRMVSAIGRLKPGVTLESARAELALIGRRLAATYPTAYDQAAGFAVTAVAIRDEMTARARPLLLTLAGATGFVLLLVCANVANLMLARLAERDRELSLRSALGAGRARLARQLLTESLILALAGGAAGVVLAFMTRDLLVAFVSTLTLRAGEIAIDRSALAFTLGTSLVTGLVFGVVPALTLASPARATVIPRRRIRQALIATQVAISFALLIGAGLFVRSFLKVRAVDAGFDADRVLTGVVNLDWVEYDTDEKRREFFAALLDRLARRGGVESAAFSLTFPLNNSDRFNLWLITDDAKQRAAPRQGDFRLASADYFRTIGMTLLDGRTFNAVDGTPSRRVAIVNLSMARHAFGAASAIGRRLSFDQGATWCRIVGVVNDVKQYGLTSAATDEVYLPFDQRPPLAATVLVRTRAEPGAMWQDIQRTVYELDPRQAVSRPLTLNEARSRSMASPRAVALLVSLFALLSLAVTAGGIAGVVSFSVTQRSVEIAVRRALGASRSLLVRMMVGQAVAPVAVGLSCGATLALVMARAVRSQLFEVRPTDPATYAAVGAALVVIAALSGLAPAARAATIEPSASLRRE